VHRAGTVREKFQNQLVNRINALPTEPNPHFMIYVCGTYPPWIITLPCLWIWISLEHVQKVVLHALIGLQVIFMDLSFFIDAFSFSETVFFTDLFPILSLDLGVWLLNKGLTDIHNSLTDLQGRIKASNFKSKRSPISLTNYDLNDDHHTPRITTVV
jgi:hypothetical protein